MLNLEEWSEKMNNFLTSDEGKKSVEDYFGRIEKQNAILKSQLDRFHATNPDLDELIPKIIDKYNSNKYINRWYSRSIEPPEDLYWFLYEYANGYGDGLYEPDPRIYECMRKGFINDFTTSGFIIGNWFISRMDGQGSVIHIDKMN